MKCQVMPSTYIFATSHGNPAREASSLAPPISTKLWKNLLWTSQVRGGAPCESKAPRCHLSSAPCCRGLGRLCTLSTPWVGLIIMQIPLNHFHKDVAKASSHLLSPCTIPVASTGLSLLSLRAQKVTEMDQLTGAEPVAHGSSPPHPCPRQLSEMMHRPCDH